MKTNIFFLVHEMQGKISGVDFVRRKRKKSNKLSSLELRCMQQINEYFSCSRKKFSVPILFKGTIFQEKVWREIQKIPYGEIISYKELSQKIGAPKAYRAVANACKKNPLPIIIPCHRVVASNGLGGYFAGINKKEIINDRIF